jgi:hypothetical protein
MVADLPDARDGLAADLPLQPPVVEKGDVLRPRQSDHHPEPATRGLVEQVDARRCVGPNGVDAEIRHAAEVVGDLGGRGELVSLSVGCEGAVGDALHQESFVTGEQKFPVPDDTGAGNRRRILVLFQQAGLKRCTHKILRTPRMPDRGQRLVYQEVGANCGSVSPYHHSTSVELPFDSCTMVGLACGELPSDAALDPCQA